MKISQSISIALCFAYSALSAPTPPSAQSKGGSFKVERTRRGSGTLYGPAALRKAYQKYGIVPTNIGIDLDDFEPVVKEPVVKVATASKSGSNIVEPDQKGAVSASSVGGDVSFVSPIRIGGQELVITFDTGSSDLWVMDTRLPEVDQVGHTVYDPSKSTTFRGLDGYQFKITYGDDSYAQGEVGLDTVDVGGATVTNQAIGLPLKVAASFVEETYSDGLVGLGFSSLNTVTPQQQKSLFENIAASLDEPVFASSLKTGGVGEFEFGTIDHAKYKGDMVNVSIDSSNGFWSFESSFYRVGSGQIEKNSQGLDTIADTGTSLMLLAQPVVDAYYSEVPGALYIDNAGGYIYPCTATLPNFSIAIGPQNLATIPGELLYFSEVGTNTTTGERLCYGGIQSNQGSSMQILGDTFLKAFFVVFDLRGPSLGVASPI